MRPSDDRFRRLCKALDYQFNQIGLLQQALTHRSHGSLNNERFEFIGDSILNYTVARMLFDRFPSLTEGELSRLRANLVNQQTLADVALSLALGDDLLLGEGELKSGGFNRPSILADAMEAIFAAVSFDADFAAAERVVRGLYADRVASIDPTRHAKDAKTRLQETLQAQKLPLPKYRISLQRGEAHEQWFCVVCDLAELGMETTGEGGSRRAAEQAAADRALAVLAQQQAVKGKKRR